MINGEPVLGVILARGGSKRLPRKNLRVLAGKPLIVWTIETGLAGRHLDRLVLSSDDEEIMAVARAARCEVPFRRPDELAQDDTLPGEAIIHALEALNWRDGYVVLLQPTSPLREAADIDACIESCVAAGAPACATVVPVNKPAHWLMTLNEEGYVRRLLPQGLGRSLGEKEPDAYLPNGAVYVARVSWFLQHRTFWTPETLAQRMPPERSIDIDTEYDFWLAEQSLVRASGAREETVC